MPKDKLDELIKSVDLVREPPNGNAFEAMRRMELVMDAVEKAGEPQKAAQCFSKLRETFAWALPPQPNAVDRNGQLIENFQPWMRHVLTYVPIWEAKHKQWDIAARDSEICAVKLNSNAPDLTWLHGWVLKQASLENPKANAAAPMSLALMTEGIRRTMVSPERASELGDMMQTMGEFGAAGDILDRLARFSEPRSTKWYEAARRRSQVLTAKDPVQSWQLWQKYQLVVLDHERVSYTDPLTYVTMARDTQFKYAMALVVQGQPAKAVTEFLAVAKNMPPGSDGVHEFVQYLKEKGYPAEARQVYDACAARSVADCEKYPKSWNVRNELAWMSVRCDFEMERAVEVAQRAVDLQPRDTDSIDTLAESHLKMGHKDIALELMRKCQKLEPNVARHRDRYAEFEKYGN